MKITSIEIQGHYTPVLTASGKKAIVVECEGMNNYYHLDIENGKHFKKITTKATLSKIIDLLNEN